MSTDLCPKHNLAIAPDGKCVLCRRPGPTFVLQREDESMLSRALTWLLLMCLVATFGALVYIARNPAGHQGARYVRNDAPQPDESAAAARLDDSDDVVNDAPATPAAETSLATQPIDEATSLDALEGSATDATDATATQDVPETLRARPAPPEIPVEALASARQKVEVTMFVAPWCYICDRSRDFLRARDVVLVEYDIELDPEALDALSDVNPAGTIPTFQIGDQTIVGFHPWVLEDAVNAEALEHFASR